MRQTIHHYARLFENLNCAKTKKYGEAPHKPVLLLTLIELVRSGCLTQQEIVPTEKLRHTFEQIWRTRVKNGHYQCDVAKPFFHMRNEPFWQLIAQSGHEQEATDKSKMRNWQKLQNAVAYAYIDAELAQCFTNETERSYLESILIWRYFAYTTPKSTYIFSTTKQHIASAQINENIEPNETESRKAA